MRLITIKNADGVTLQLNDREFIGRFALIDADGLYAVDGNVTATENSMTDGSTYLGTTQRARNVVLTLRDRPGADHEGARRVLYNVFALKKLGTLTYQENGAARQIGFYAEKITSDGQPQSRTYTISLICPDPMFEDTADIRADSEVTNGLFEWIHEFDAAGEEFGTLEAGEIEIVNQSAGDNIGFTAVIRAGGAVLNPYITHAETGEIMQIGDGEAGTATALELAANDVLTITTHPGNMRAFVTRDATGLSEEVTSLMTFESEFLRIRFGVNTFSYGADSGAEGMNVTLYYRNKYPAV